MKLLVLPSGNRLQINYAALKAGVVRYIGRLPLDPATRGYAPTGKPEEVEAINEYVIAVKDGDLLAADEATAEYCGVKFDKSK